MVLLLGGVSNIMVESDWHYYEVEQTKVGNDDIVIDCGAAEGLFSLMVAKRCRKVYAIEPLPRFVESMKLTFSKFDNVEIVPCALSDEKGFEKMSSRGVLSSMVGLDEDGVRVKVNTVDNLFVKKRIRVDYIKADLEGYEMKMLRGASETIRAYDPKIAITTYHKANDAEEISAFLKHINPSYNIRLKGISNLGGPMMLHAWVD
jgi:FkbM family methyltransferase